MRIASKNGRDSLKYPPARVLKIRWEAWIRQQQIQKGIKTE